ncbi:DNA-binding response regulator [Streptomyces sp. V4-01]|uniref:DNA-binding response regulator n=1 Tax=Actinacidiphila polyblastidii TaxID=3110430 RepID=A0ABU7PFL5_9ACTN|nr:DNA-binding response regulator [Streptomyces sp. V4-01]
MTSVLHIDDTDVRILMLMRAGFSDATISRKLSRGHRTIQRRIGQMMDRFGVSGRFALGVRVAELNLLASVEIADSGIGMSGSASARPL